MALFYFAESKGLVRIGGRNRYEISVNLASRIGLPSRNIAVISGEYKPGEKYLFLAEALLGGSLLSKQGGPLLLAARQGLPPQTDSFLQEQRERDHIYQIYTIDGSQRINEKVISSLKEYLE
ncbi:cell wall-binding repeat-containing protein [Bacillus infantis]|uniref:cell wall-binding repeat-containing protein n=1 Tax=Bacillus infantis TaxID=324767 RepID=UPI003CEACA7B